MRFIFWSKSSSQKDLLNICKTIFHRNTAQMHWHQSQYTQKQLLHLLQHNDFPNDLNLCTCSVPTHFCSPTSLMLPCCYDIHTSNSQLLSFSCHRTCFLFFYKIVSIRDHFHILQKIKKIKITSINIYHLHQFQGK